MDELITAIHKTLSYVNIVQNSCDQQRAFLERTFRKEFHHYVEEWNKKREIVKEADDAKAVQENLEVLELEEIALADNLLRKAKRIREKFKIPSLDENFLNSEVENVKLSKNDIDSKKREPILSRSNITKNMKQSSSLPLINSAKTRIPNSTHISKTLKERVQSSDHLSRGKIPLPKSLVDGRSAIITKTQLNSYRHICAETNSRTVSRSKNSFSAKEDVSFKSKFAARSNNEEKHTGGNKASKTHLLVTSKNSVKLAVTLQESRVRPTHTEFLKFSLGCEEPMRSDFSQCIWYPFLNSKNATRITVSIRCNDVKELKQICTLLHKIQETAFWLDLFHLLGNEVIPQLNQPSQKEQNIAVVSSYVQSVFHPKLRRRPMIIEAGFD